MILFLSTGLEKVLRDEKRIAGEIIFSFFFIGANIALWIFWSGEWVQDILFGIPYVYFLWLLIRGIKRSFHDLLRNKSDGVSSHRKPYRPKIS